MAQAATAQQPLTVPDNLNRMRHHARPQVPPASLNENVFDVHPDHSGDPLVALARQVLKGGRQSAEQSLALAIAVREDTTMTPAGAELRIRDGVFSATRGPLSRIQEAVERLSEKIAKLEDHCSGPPAPVHAVTQMKVVECQKGIA